MISYTVIGQILSLLVVANGAPIIARELLGERGDWPLVFGWLFCDGRPLLGPSKTIRGVVAVVGATGCASLRVHKFLSIGDTMICTRRTG